VPDHKSLAEPAAALIFGPFRLLMAQRLLLEGEKSVRLGSRAMDILIALVERAGELVGKAELMAVVWPNIFVEESNLKVNVAALRRALGDGQGGRRYIATAAGQGYRFVAPIRAAAEEELALSQRVAEAKPNNLPLNPARLIGRGEVVRDLVQRLRSQRLLTLVGPGGIGKTAVALAVAEKLTADYEHGVWLVNIAPVAEPRLVSAAFASALGLEILSEDPLPSLIAAVKDKQALIVRDNCEHVIDAAAELTAELLKGARHVHVLATSREPLRVVGETVRRLTPLESPPRSAVISAEVASSFSAVRFFVERVAATVNEYDFLNTDAPAVAEICRTLDGVPLAIQLAAARVESLGVNGVAARLDDSLHLLSKGQRAGALRHRTISATLDWSYQLLALEEQSVLRRLALFPGGFSLGAACTVAADPQHVSSDVAETVADLAMKSLVQAEAGDQEIRYRLLETTRAYALTKLRESGGERAVAQRHATYFRDLLERAGSPSFGEGRATAYLAEIDNIRSALMWAFGPDGSQAIGVSLAVLSAPLWLELSLMTECRRWTEVALERLDRSSPDASRQEMALQTARGHSLIYADGTTRESRETLDRARALAETAHDADYQLRGFTSRILERLRREDYENGLAIGRQAEKIVTPDKDPAAASAVNCLTAYSLFLLAEYDEALAYCEKAHDHMTYEERRAQIVRFGFDFPILARSVAAQVFWSQGLLDQAAEAGRNALAEAEGRGHPLTLASALAWCGCRLSLKLGDLETAGRSIVRLKTIAKAHGLTHFYFVGGAYAGHLCALQGDLTAGVNLMREALNGLREAEHEFLTTAFLWRLAAILASADRSEEARAAIDEALRRLERVGRSWMMVEALRVKGEVLLSSRQEDAAAEAASFFNRSLDLARREGSLSYELLAAQSYGRWLHMQGRTPEAYQLLSSAYVRFVEGFQFPDLQTARRLLDEWGPKPTRRSG
jgi:predicted ATPase/DNA-binding winged helix-turn-helix (wHTH) protein